LVLDGWDSFQEGRILTEQGFSCQSNLRHFLGFGQKLSFRSRMFRSVPICARRSWQKGQT